MTLIRTMALNARIMHHLLDLYDERQAQGAPSFAFSPQAGIHSRVCELVRKYTLWGPKFHVGKRRRGKRRRGI